MKHVNTALQAITTVLLVITIGLLLHERAEAADMRVTAQTNVASTYRSLDGRTRDLSGLVWDGKDMVVTRNVIRVWDGDNGGIIRNATFRLSRPTTNEGDLPVGLEFVGGKDWLVENVTSRDFIATVKGEPYANGDCLSGERKASRLTFRNVRAINCSDGGFDFKSTDMRFEDTTADTVGFGYRIWGLGNIGTTMTCANWSKGCIQGNTAGSLVVDHLILKPAVGKATNFGVSKGFKLHIKSCSGELAGGTVLFFQAGATKANTDVILCGVKVVGQTDAQLRAQITGALQPTGACTFAKPLRDSNNDGVIDLGTINRLVCKAYRVKLIGNPTAAPYTYGIAK